MGRTNPPLPPRGRDHGADRTATSTTIAAELRAAARDSPDTEAVVDGESRWTYRELSAEVDRFACALIAHGLRPGDRVVVWAPNSARWIIAALGTIAAGGVLTPINTRFRGSEARYAIDKVRATMLIVEDSFLGTGYLSLVRGGDGAGATVEAPVPACPSLKRVVAVDRTGVGDASCLDYDVFLADAARTERENLDARVAGQHPDDIVDILFTSGTTGYPKGAMVTHRSNLLVNKAWGDIVGLTRGDRYLLLNPFFHSFGYRAGILACLIRRATMVPMAAFDVQQTLEVVERERITVFPGAPTIYTSLLDDPRRSEYDLSSVRIAVTGATVVPVPLIRRMRDELGFRTVITAYGLTECTGTATVCPPDTDDGRISTSSGLAIPGVEVRIVGPDGSVLRPREQGEIHIRGVNVMAGYFEDEQATADAVDADGWLHTGDVGWMDEDGYLWITDRIKNVFMVGGFNVYPAEVERMIREHSAVSDVAVVGVPDERMGEVGRAYVQLRPGATLDEGALLAFCAEHMANYKRPRSIEFVPELPRTASGKIQKYKLAETS